MGVLTRALVVTIVVFASGSVARALETDQYYAWERAIADSEAAINAWVNREIESELAEIRSSRARRPPECEAVTHRIVARFRSLLFHDVVTFVSNSPEVDRYPKSYDEVQAYRRGNQYKRAMPWQVINWMPPSPTLEAAGVRFGADKFGHFFSQGGLYYRWYRSARSEGLDAASARQLAIRRGLVLERLFLGGTLEGVLSPADLEGNYQGMRFYAGLCERPALELAADGWRLAVPFRLREYLTPEWDESWAPNLVTDRVFRKLEPALRAYCPKLDDPATLGRRAYYAAIDRITETERALYALLEERAIPDPTRFRLETVCR